MWEFTKLIDLLDSHVALANRDEEILREILVRFSIPPITWRQSRIIGVYMERVFVHRRQGESNENIAKRTKGTPIIWGPRGVWIIPPEPRVKILFKSVTGKKYSRILPLEAVRSLAMNAIRHFYRTINNPQISSIPFYCPVCGAKMIRAERPGLLGAQWRCPEHHSTVYEQDLGEGMGVIG